MDYYSTNRAQVSQTPSNINKKKRTNCSQTRHALNTFKYSSIKVKRVYHVFAKLQDSVWLNDQTKQKEYFLRC